MPRPADRELDRWADDVATDATPGTVAAFVQVPIEVASRPVDPRSLLTSDKGRWNDYDRPTLYLASDVAVALSEFARHLDTRPGASLPQDDARAIIEVRLALPSILDLRRVDVVRSLDVGTAPLCFLDAELARSLARALRGRTSLAAIRTQPMAFLDAPDRWNLVVFPENLAETGWSSAARPVGSLRLEEVASRDRQP